MRVRFCLKAIHRPLASRRKRALSKSSWGSGVDVFDTGVYVVQASATAQRLLPLAFCSVLRVTRIRKQPTVAALRHPFSSPFQVLFPASARPIRLRCRIAVKDDPGHRPPIRLLRLGVEQPDVRAR